MGRLKFLAERGSEKFICQLPLAIIGRKSAVIHFGWLQVRGPLTWLIWSTAHLYFLVGFRNCLWGGLTGLWN